MKKWIAVLATATVLAITPVAVGSAVNAFKPDDTVTKRDVAVAVYEMVRDHPAFQQAPSDFAHPNKALKYQLIDACKTVDNPFGDIDSETAFKQKAILCAHEWGVFGDPKPKSNESESIASGTHGDWRLDENDSGYWIASTNSSNGGFLLVGCISGGISAAIALPGTAGAYSGDDVIQNRYAFHPNGYDSGWVSGSYWHSLGDNFGATYLADAEEFARRIRANGSLRSVEMSNRGRFDFSFDFDSYASSTFSMKGAAKAVRLVMQECGLS